MPSIPNNILRALSARKGLVALVLAAFIIRLAYGLCTNFTETNTRYLQDYTQIYLLGLKFYTTGIWPYWGPDITYTFSQIPGALQGLLVGLPLYLLALPESPFIFLNILSTLSLAFFAWYISKRIPAIPPWIIYALLLTSPWTMNFSTTVINPSYVLAPAILFFTAIIELLPVYKEKVLPRNLCWLLTGFSTGWILQVHMSWVLLPFYILAALYFLARTKNARIIVAGTASLALGMALGLSTLAPTFLKFGFAGGGTGSAIVFNPSNLKSIDILTRFIAFSTFDVRQFIGDGLPGARRLLSGNPWSAPFIIFLFLAGTAQVVYYVSWFFRRSAHPESRHVKAIAIGSVLLTYISYLFVVRDVASYTFYLLLPVSFWYSFYCLEPLFKRVAWRRTAAFLILSGLIFHAALAREHFAASSLYSRRGLISRALKERDSRLFAYRRVAAWENEARAPYWKRDPVSGAGTRVITYFNDFDRYPPEILPEELNNKWFSSGPFSCRIDSVNPFGIGLSVPFSEAEMRRIVTVSLAGSFIGSNEGLLVISVTSGEKTLYWSGDKMFAGSLEPGRWTKVCITKELPAISDRSALIRIYAWVPVPHSSSWMFVDDFRVTFE